MKKIYYAFDVLSGVYTNPLEDLYKLKVLLRDLFLAVLACQNR